METGNEPPVVIDAVIDVVIDVVNVQVACIATGRSSSIAQQLRLALHHCKQQVTCDV